MTSWNFGYVTDIAYTSEAYRELAPDFLGFVALATGFVGPDANKPLTYCELGCGQGFSANLIAAANPHIEVYANDFNPTHIHGARLLAEAAGLSNIRFYEQRFADFLKQPDLPDFDMIVLHGVYSWVSPEIRSYIVDFMRTKLKVGGLVYVSYNALPGWASVMPLRRLMVNEASCTRASSAQRMEEAISFVQRLVDVKPRYLQMSPGVAERFESIKTLSKNFVAHEYFSAESNPFYHADVAAELNEAKLSYIGSARILDNFDATNLTAEQAALLKDISNLTVRQTVRDYMVNQQARCDIFVKGTLPLTTAEQADVWGPKRFVLSIPGADAPSVVKGAVGDGCRLTEVYEPVLDVLAAGPCTVAQLREDARIASLPIAALAEAITLMVGLGIVQPALDAAGDAERKKTTQPFNLAVIKKARLTNDLAYLASPVSGSAVAVDRISQLFLLALYEGHQDAPAYVCEVLSSMDIQMSKDGKALQTHDEIIAELRDVFGNFKQRALPVLKLLGIT